MRMTKLRAELRLAVRNLRRNRRRSLVTGLGVLSGYVGLVLLAGYVARTERYLMVNTVYVNHTGHVAIYREGGLDRYLSKPRAYLISAEERGAIDAVLAGFADRIEFASPYLLTNGLVQAGEKSQPFQAKGITKDADARVRAHSLVRRWTPELVSPDQDLFAGGTDEADAPVALTGVVDDKLDHPSSVQLLGSTIDGGFNAIEAPVAFTFSTGLALTESTGLKGSYGSFAKLLETDGATYVGVFLKSDLQARATAGALNRAFREKGLPFEAFSFFDERIGLFYTGTMNFLYAMSTFFLILVSGVVVLTVTNAVSMSILERVREIGTLRAIGFRQRDIARLLSLECFVLCVFSLAIGDVVAQAIAAAVNAAGIRFHAPGIAGDLQMVLTPWAGICAIVAAVLAATAVITAFVVAKRKLNVRVAALLSETAT